jgi:hypothetical protein
MVLCICAGGHCKQTTHVITCSGWLIRISIHMALTEPGISFTPLIIKHTCFCTKVIISSTALGGRWRPQSNVASDLYPRHLPSNFYSLFPCVFLYLVNPYLFWMAMSSLTSRVCTQYLFRQFVFIHLHMAHLSLLDFITLTHCGPETRILVIGVFSIQL